MVSHVSGLGQQLSTMLRPLGISEQRLQMFCLPSSDAVIGYLRHFCYTASMFLSMSVCPFEFLRPHFKKSADSLWSLLLKF